MGASSASSLACSASYASGHFILAEDAILLILFFLSNPSYDYLYLHALFSKRADRFLQLGHVLNLPLLPVGAPKNAPLWDIIQHHFLQRARILQDQTPRVTRRKLLLVVPSPPPSRPFIRKRLEPRTRPKQRAQRTTIDRAPLQVDLPQLR